MAKMLRFRVCLQLVLMIAALFAPPVLDARVSAQDLRLTRFGDVISTVMSADDSAQREFVVAALDVMVDAYLVEIRRVDELGAKAQSERASWRSGTLNYVRRLEKALAAAEHGAAIFITQEVDGSIRFVVGGEQIMFHAPRLSAQRHLEATLVEHYCLKEYCARGHRTVEDKTRAQMEQVTGQWEFSSRSKPTYTAGDGLKCVFEDQRHLTLRRQACKSLIYELRFLAEALKALRAQGSRIDWGNIVLTGGSAALPNKVTYNQKREYFHARLPTLWRAQAMLREAIPWLQARTLGNVREFTIKPPDNVTYSPR